MSRKRVGCYACFQTLDCKDTQPNLREIFKCETCGVLYHAACVEGLEACYRCSGQSFLPVHIARPARLTGITKERVQPIRPSTVLIVDGAGNKKRKQNDQKKKGSTGVLDSLVYGIQALWAIIFALLLVTIAASIGTYFYRILKLPFFSIQMVMDAILRAAPPASAVIIGAVASGLIVGFVSYSRPHQSGRRFTYLLAGLVGLAAFNLWQLDLAPAYFLRFTQAIVDQNLEQFCAQGVTAVAVLLLVPLHQALAPIRIRPERSSPAWLNNLYGWLRLSVASIFVIVVVIYFVTHWLPLEPQLKLVDIYSLNLPNKLAGMSILTAAAIAGALSVAALFYWPPPFRHVQWRLGIVRLFVFLTGVAVVGFLYQAPINPLAMLNTVLFTGVMMLLGIPIQRALS